LPGDLLRDSLDDEFIERVLIPGGNAAALVVT